MRLSTTTPRDSFAPLSKVLLRSATNEKSRSYLNALQTSGNSAL